MSFPQQQPGESDEDYADRLAARRARRREAARERRNQTPEERAAALAAREQYFSAEARAARAAIQAEADRAYARARYPELKKRYNEDAAFRAHLRKKNREAERLKRAVPDDHPGTCDLCGVRPPLMRNGARGLQQDHRHDNNAIRGYLCSRCNRNVSSLDLAFTDPDYFAKLKAWSLKGAPVVPVRSRQPRKRCHRPPDKGLFD
jgi:hypothetical protein